MSAPARKSAEALAGRFGKPLQARMAAFFTSSWALGVLIGVLSWNPDFPLIPTPGFDPSWQLALNLAAAEGLDFGGEVVFTFGPLGFLDFPQLVDADLARVAFLYDLILWLGLGVTLVAAARRSFPLPLAFVVALLVGLLTHYAIIVLALLWALWAVSEDAPELLRRLLPWVGGAVAAVAMLGKLNVGVLVLALVAVAAFAMEPGRRARNLATFAGSFAIVFASLWLITGQDFGDLPDFVRYSYELVSGYSLTQGLETVEDPWRYQLLAAGLLAIAIAAAWWGGRDAIMSRRVGMLALVGIAAFCGWKFAFVRHELIRSVDLVAVPLATLLAFRWRGPARFAALAALAAVAIAYFPLTGLSPGDSLRPLQNAEDAFDQARTVFDGSRGQAALDAARDELQAFYGLDPQTRELLGERRVHVYPFETPLAWAYELNWDPLPVFQSNAAWTTELDQLNADAIGAPDGPELILVHPPALSRGTGADYFRALTAQQGSELELANNVSVGLHYMSFDQPRATLAMLCNFVPLRTTLQFAVLQRVDDRCGTPRLLDAFEVGSGEEFEIPHPPSANEVVFADVEGLEPHGLERAGTLLYRTAPRHVTFDRGLPLERDYLLAPAIADHLLLSSSDAVDFPQPYRLAPRASTVAFSEESGFLDSPGELRVELFSLPVQSLSGDAGGKRD